MEDIIRILAAFVIGYFAFVTIFYYLAKLMFSKVELDEDYEKLVAMYRRSKPSASASNTNKKFDPSAFKLSHSLRHRINYNKA